MSDIAIVGLDCRFPGAADAAALWQLLLRSDDAITEVPAARWLSSEFYSEQGGPGTSNTRQGGFIADADAFDYECFGISPREAEAMDPQQRLALQNVWRALEDATLDPRAQAGSRTGVFVGVMTNEWAHLQITDYANLTPHRCTGNGHCMIANRLSYVFDFKGPSLAVDTACSSSLVATQLACNALRIDECEQAVVVGVSLTVIPSMNIFYTQAGLSAPDGRCRPFSAEARGIGRGEGIATLILRRLHDAQRQGLPIYAVIKGGAVNQDGRSNGLTAPNRTAQREVMRDAYRRAGVQAEQLHFIEAHGTGTVLGDLIESNALGDVHGVPRRQPCAIGSIKGNIGHAEGAAGLAGLIKTALALHHGILPASCHGEPEHAGLHLSEKGLRLVKTAEKLPGGNVLAAVSSFGLGGTNAHLVLGSAPRVRVEPSAVEAAIVTVSAATAEGLEQNIALFAQDLDKQSPRWFTQTCWTSNQVKASGRWRMALAATNRAHALMQLQRLEAGNHQAAAAVAPIVGWLFTGQGSQYAGMSRPLFERCGAYRRVLREVDATLRTHLGQSIIDLLLAEQLATTCAAVAQPAAFAVGYAMGRVLLDAGLAPAWMIGHSIGEYAMAALAGVFSLDDACRLIAARGRLMDGLPERGVMLALACSADRAAELFDAREPLDIAAYNSSDSIVVAGDEAAVTRVEAAALLAGLGARRLRVSHAFHSELMTPMLDEFAALAATLTYRSPEVPVYSTVTGARWAPGTAMDANYWVRQIREPVQFARACAGASQIATASLIEIGPRPVLTALWRRVHPQWSGIATAPCPGPNATGLELLDSVAGLYRAGARVRWDALYEPSQRVRRRLSPYRFSTRHRFWLASARPAESTARFSSESTLARVAQLIESRPLRDDSDELVNQVIDLIADLGGYPASSIDASTRLAEDLGYDSIVLLKLRDHFEKRWARPIDLKDFMADIGTVGDLVAVIRGGLVSSPPVIEALHR